MKHLLIISYFFVCISTLAEAQVKGVVMDKNKQPLEFANIVLYSLPDSAFVMGTVSDEKGYSEKSPVRFSFQI